MPRRGPERKAPLTVKSWVVLREAIEEVGVKAVAAKLGLSSALIYKWCQEPTQDDPGSSGARNPLDRIHLLYELTKDPRIVNWLCHEAGGFFVENPVEPPGPSDQHLLGTTQQMVQNFSAMLAEISKSIANDGLIQPHEAERIRQTWEQLKTQAERFTVACERGMYDKLP